MSYLICHTWYVMTNVFGPNMFVADLIANKKTCMQTNTNRFGLISDLSSLVCCDEYAMTDVSQAARQFTNSNWLRCDWLCCQWLHCDRLRCDRLCRDRLPFDQLRCQWLYRNQLRWNWLHCNWVCSELQLSVLRMTAVWVTCQVSA